MILNRKGLANLAAGDCMCGDVLYRMTYWYERAEIMWHGLLWFARRREDLAQDCVISLKQFARAVRVLRAKGLIETRQGLFGGYNIFHGRLTAAGCKAMGLPMEGGVQAGLAKSGKTPSGQTGAGYCQAGYSATGSSNEDSSYGMTKPSKVPKGKYGQANGLFSKATWEENLETARSILKYDHPFMSEYSDSLESLEQLEQVWKTENAIGDDPKAGWGPGERSFARRLRTACPQGMACEVIRWAVRNWNEFDTHVRSTDGKSAPQAPVIEYLAVYSKVALHHTVKNIIVTKEFADLMAE